jgi:hypothetical protein
MAMVMMLTARSSRTQQMWQYILVVALLHSTTMHEGAALVAQ